MNLEPTAISVLKAAQYLITILVTPSPKPHQVSWHVVLGPPNDAASCLKRCLSVMTT